MGNEKYNLKKAKRIEKQVERWDLFAKMAPTIFLFVCFLLLINGTNFGTVFFIGMVCFSLTAVTWWFWTIFSIRYLVKLFYKASNDLIETSEELKSIRKEYFDEKTNSSKSN